jgi:hypothetical protein
MWTVAADSKRRLPHPLCLKMAQLRWKEVRVSVSKIKDEPSFLPGLPNASKRICLGGKFLSSQSFTKMTSPDSFYSQFFQIYLWHFNQSATSEQM